MRPADLAFGEDESALARACRAKPLHTGRSDTTRTGLLPTTLGPRAVRPVSASSPRARGSASSGSRRRLFCGGGWYADVEVAEACAELGYVDCTPRAARPPYLPPGERWASLTAPAVLELPSGRTLGAIPTTHSLGDLARALRRRVFPDLVHVYFHDTDLLDRRRRALLGARSPTSRAPRSCLRSRRPRCSHASRSASRRVGRRGAALTSTGCPARSLRRRRPHALRRHLRERVVTFAPRASTSSRAGRSLDVVRRVLSVAALVALDIAGLALGIYLALVVRELVTGNGDVLWGLLWREGPAEWLKFAAPITVLVFAQAGLYRRRELRPGAGRILACLIVVALIVLAFGIGTGYDFSTSGLIPTSVDPLGGHDRAAPGCIRIGVARGDARGGDSPPGRPRRRGREPRTLARLPRIGPGRAVVRVRGRRGARRRPRLPAAGWARGAPGRPRPGSAGRGDPHRGRLRRAHRLRGRRAGAQAGHQGAARTRHDRAPRAARRVRAGPGRAAVRAAPARPDRLGLGGEARIRPRRQRARHRGRAAAVAAHRARDQDRLARADLLRRSPHRRRRARVRDAQVPDDGRRVRPSSSRSSRT